MTLTEAPSANPAVTPALAGYHHVDLTVTDVEASQSWYEQVFGLQPIMREPHPDGVGYAVVLHRPGTALFLGLSHHRGNQGEEFHEARTGLDHVSFAVPVRADLNAWLTHLDRLDVAHTGITERCDPFDYALIVLRDPDNIQLEITWS